MIAPKSNQCDPAGTSARRGPKPQSGFGLAEFCFAKNLTLGDIKTEVIEYAKE
jgi:hypothetical protein